MSEKSAEQMRLAELKEDRRRARKDRMAIAIVILALLVLLFMMIDGAVINFQCSFTEFITFECNRWDASFKKWE